METEFKRDLYHNFMVIRDANTTVDDYVIKMLEYQKIDGILPLEKRIVDNNQTFYYDITGKQCIVNQYEKGFISYNEVIELFMNLIKVMERAYEYLMQIDDFILLPDKIYLSKENNKPFLTYLPGYNKNMLNQMSSFIEYIMNKIDHNDKDAVLFVYELYAKSREEEYTLVHIKDTLYKYEEKQYERPPVEEEKRLSVPQIPIMEERIETEEEQFCYPLKTYVFTSIIILTGCLILALGWKLQLFYNAFGNYIEYSKLFIAVILVFCVEGYLLKVVWNRKYRITKVVSKHEYINPVLEPIEKKSKVEEKRKEHIQEDRMFKNENDGTGLITEEEDNNPTCLLNIADKEKHILLQPVEGTTYESIWVKDFPFFIGKHKENVDYLLKKEVVSRYHAKITRENGKYFIVDLNSTNGTYINSQLLNTYQRQEIKFGDKIAFANIEYYFLEK